MWFEYQSDYILYINKEILSIALPHLHEINNWHILKWGNLPVAGSLAWEGFLCEAIHPSYVGNKNSSQFLARDFEVPLLISSERKEGGCTCILPGPADDPDLGWGRMGLTILLSPFCWDRDLLLAKVKEATSR
jgi:hypothetical protein